MSFTAGPNPQFSHFPGSTPDFSLAWLCYVLASPNWQSIKVAQTHWSYLFFLYSHSKILASQCSKNYFLISPTDHESPFSPQNSAESSIYHSFRCVCLSLGSPPIHPRSMIFPSCKLCLFLRLFSLLFCQCNVMLSRSHRRLHIYT